jgi:predicted nucleic acid-binding protein
MTNKPRVFVDTNVLVYAVTQGKSQAGKTLRAREILLGESWCWSTQVALEFVSVVTRKKNGPLLDWAEAMAYVQTWMAFPMAAMSPERLVESMAIKERFGVSIWDAAILAAANALQCSIVYSEDLNHGQTYGSVRVCNPF